MYWTRVLMLVLVAALPIALAVLIATGRVTSEGEPAEGPRVRRVRFADDRVTCYVAIDHAAMSCLRD